MSYVKQEVQCRQQNTSSTEQNSHESNANSTKPAAAGYGKATKPPTATANTAEAQATENELSTESSGSTTNCKKYLNNCNWTISAATDCAATLST
jgi:hypothetical protein